MNPSNDPFSENRAYSIDGSVLLYDVTIERFSVIAEKYQLNKEELRDTMKVTNTVITGIPASAFGLPLPELRSRNLPETLELVCPDEHADKLLKWLKKDRDYVVSEKPPCILQQFLAPKTWEVFEINKKEKAAQTPLFRITKLTQESRKYSESLYDYLCTKNTTLKMTLLSGNMWTTLYRGLFDHRIVYARTTNHICDEENRRIKEARALGFYVFPQNDRLTVPCIDCPRSYNGLRLNEDIPAVIFSYTGDDNIANRFPKTQKARRQRVFSSICLNYNCPYFGSPPDAPRSFFIPSTPADHYLLWVVQGKNLIDLSRKTNTLLYSASAAIYIPSHCSLGPRHVSIPFFLQYGRREDKEAAVQTWLEVSTNRTWSLYAEMTESNKDGEFHSSLVFIDRFQRWNRSPARPDLDFILVRRDQYGPIDCTQAIVPSSWPSFVRHYNLICGDPYMVNSRA
ncbi:hypothetical protein VKT23_013058 [Stygiomarasmius scandens]|uniref:Uncharacterized protein n=1 Tax=Marasmiellus scandens TaxID=2682957 RepID=A0ABR1J5M8_9AGAR